MAVGGRLPVHGASRARRCQPTGWKPRHRRLRATPSRSSHRQSSHQVGCLPSSQPQHHGMQRSHRLQMSDRTRHGEARHCASKIECRLPFGCNGSSSFEERLAQVLPTVRSQIEKPGARGQPEAALWLRHCALLCAIGLGMPLESTRPLMRAIWDRWETRTASGSRAAAGGTDSRPDFQQQKFCVRRAPARHLGRSERSGSRSFVVCPSLAGALPYPLLKNPKIGPWR
jgi:hypothetical protein